MFNDVTVDGKPVWKRDATNTHNLCVWKTGIQRRWNTIAEVVQGTTNPEVQSIRPRANPPTRGSWLVILFARVGLGPSKTGSLSRLRVKAHEEPLQLESIYLTYYIGKCHASIHATPRSPTNSWLSWLFHLFLLIGNDVIIFLTQSKYPRLIRIEQMEMGFQNEIFCNMYRIYLIVF